MDTCLASDFAATIQSRRLNIPAELFSFWSARKLWPTLKSLILGGSGRCVTWWSKFKQHAQRLTFIDCIMQISFRFPTPAMRHRAQFRHINIRHPPPPQPSAARSVFMCHCYQFGMCLNFPSLTLFYFKCNHHRIWCFFNCRAYSRMSAFYRWKCSKSYIRWSLTDKIPPRARKMWKTL